MWITTCFYSLGTREKNEKVIHTSLRAQIYQQKDISWFLRRFLLKVYS